MHKKICLLCLLLLVCAAAAAYADGTYSSTTAGTHALSVTSGSSSYSNITATKTGDVSGQSDDYDWKGTNAAVHASGGAKLTITGESTITSNATYGNAVFSYGGNLNGSNSGDGTTITISDATITTSKNNSGGIMATGGGKIVATNLTINTSGSSSSAIRSGKGGGTITVTGGTYTTSGINSPAIYSTAQITGSDVTLESKASQAVVIEGANSVALTDSELTANHSHQAIMIYQSHSGTSDETSSFSMKNGSLSNAQGDVFYVTNATAAITLEGVEISNEDSSGYFLRAASGDWGKSSSNGGNVILKAADQVIEGNILVDSISSLTITLSGSSEFTGAINSSGQNGTVKVIVASGSTWTLTADSYVSSVTNNGTIEEGDYKLYVNDSIYSSKTSEDEDEEEKDEEDQEDQEDQEDTDTAPSITTTSLKEAIAGKYYSVILKASGSPNIMWEADSLPDGLSLNSSTGKLSGTPEEAEEYSITFTAANSAGSDSVTLDLTVKEVAPKIKGSVKAGVKDEPYSTTFTVSEGTGEITWELEGDLPEGLLFDEETATLSGVPAEAWNDYITIRAANTLETSKRYKLVIKAVKPKITTKALDSCVAGEDYSASVEVTGSKTITVTVEGLPDGLVSEFDEEEGIISIIGTPETAGKYSVEITAENSGGTAKKTLKLNVNSEPDITRTTLEDGTTGKTYSQKLTASGTTPITWSLDSDSSLPDGLTLTSKGQIKGKPTSYGSTTFTVIAENEYGSNTADITININAAIPVISPKSLKKGTAGEAYRVELTAKKGTAPITWECAGDLPVGITFEDGVFSGIPTRAFSGTVTVTAMNAAGDVAEMTYNLMIKAVAPKIATTSLPSGTVGAYYSTELETSEGTPDIFWSWRNEPDGLELDAYNGEIFGMPKTAGTYNVKVIAANDLKSVSKTLSLTIAAGINTSNFGPDDSFELEPEPERPLDPVSGFALPEGYEIVYELGEIEIDESGLYDMELELEENARIGAKLFWLARAQNREPSEDDTIAEFFGADGEDIYEVPLDRKFTVSAWLEAGVIYMPAIAVK